jgi:hypothetical protein
MALTNTYVLPITRIPDVFAKIRDGQAPDQVTSQLLKDWGFHSSNDRAFIPLLKAIGFLSADGKPTKRYHDYRDHSRSRAVMGEALKEAYGDLFLIKAKPTTADRTAIEGKFKSFHNQSDNVAQLMAKTFFGLLTLADLGQTHSTPPEKVEETPPQTMPARRMDEQGGMPAPQISGLHYNIQIHLPATKDVEVYNAIFKSLREHLIEV